MTTKLDDIEARLDLDNPFRELYVRPADLRYLLKVARAAEAVTVARHKKWGFDSHETRAAIHALRAALEAKP